MLLVVGGVVGFGFGRGSALILRVRGNWGRAGCTYCKQRDCEVGEELMSEKNHDLPGFPFGFSDCEESSAEGTLRGIGSIWSIA